MRISADYYGLIQLSFAQHKDRISSPSPPHFFVLILNYVSYQYWAEEVKIKFECQAPQRLNLDKLRISFTRSMFKTSLYVRSAASP